MSGARAPFAAALALALAGARANANPSLATDFAGISQWLSHEMAQGLAFNAGSNFDPPKEVNGYYFQPDVSLGVGRIPFDKRDFPTITVPALADRPARNLFPNSTLFPNLALHLRMGLPWRGDFYLRLADATTPSGYKISPTMTAQVQTNSVGAGVRQHFWGGDFPTLTIGAHYNHVRGATKLKGKFGVSAGGFVAEDDFIGDIAWSLNSFGVDAILSQSFGSWTPFAGMGYNYATGSVRVSLDLVSSTYLVPDVIGQGSDHPEQSQGREIIGLSYNRPTWSAFANGEVKALGQLQYRSWIVQAGVALPFDIGRSATLFSRKRALVEPRSEIDSPRRPEQAPPDMIFLR